MNVEQTKRTLYCAPPRKSILMEAGHGVGKSQVVAQVAREMSVKTGKPYGFVDMRLSQREVGDLIGMPRGVDNYRYKRSVFENGKETKVETSMTNVTVNDMPFWFPQDPDSCGILFLDELNRATREVQQAAFELVLDYRLNFRELPIGWKVVAAINENQDVYSVLSMDPALYDRFLVIKFKPTTPEWLQHAESIGVHKAIHRYITKFPNDLWTPEKVEPGVVYPSPRSWINLSDWIKELADNGDDPLNDLEYLTHLSGGYVGTTISVNFIEYIRKSYKVYSAEDILNKLNAEMLEEFKNMVPTDASFYNGEIVRYVAKEKVKLTKKQGDNLLKYYKALPKECASDFWMSFTKDAREEATRWYKSNPEIAEYTMSFLSAKQALQS